MPVGYSVSVLKRNTAADDTSIGVRLGRVCIGREIPVRNVAARLNVSTQTVYNWFVGAKAPQEKLVYLIEDYLRELS